MRLLVAICSLTLAGCAIHPRYDNAARLMARPDFPQVREAAPDWAQDALKTINFLEYELERR